LLNKISTVGASSTFSILAHLVAPIAILVSLHPMLFDFLALITYSHLLTVIKTTFDKSGTYNNDNTYNRDFFNHITTQHKRY